MPDRPVLFKRSEAGRVQDVVEHVEKNRPYIKPEQRTFKGAITVLRFGELTADLATGSLTSPSTAAAEFLDSDDNDPPQLSLSGDTFTVTNYSADLEGSSGDFIIVGRIQGIWHILSKDCP